MLKNKLGSRSLIAFLVTWAFLILTVTGLTLYIVPQGRIAYWVHWSLLGMSKEQWADVHMMFGGVFIVTGILHLYFNWKPFTKYLADRVQGRLQIKRELAVSLLVSVFIVVISIMNLPPASWVFDLNAYIKGSWVTSPQSEPPFGHAEEVSLAGITRRMGLDLNKSITALKERGITFQSKRDSLEEIARANGITPMAVYDVIRPFELASKPMTKIVLTPEEIEARYSGTGLGRKTLADACKQAGLDVATAKARLEAKQIQASTDMKMREVADSNNLTPIELLTLMLIPK